MVQAAGTCTLAGDLLAGGTAIGVASSTVIGTASGAAIGITGGVNNCLYWGLALTGV